MGFLICVYVFVVGCCIGSFMNVVIYRLPLGLNVAKGHSFCTTCEHDLHAIDLVPVFSWLFLRGKCRYCGAKISGQYAFVELLSGVLACLCLYWFGLSVEMVFVFVVLMVLLSVAMIDFHTMTIPNELNFVMFSLAVLSVILFPEIELMSRVLGSFVISIPFVLLNCLIKDAFGGGDVKLMLGAGLMLGFSRTLVAAFIGIVIAGIVAIYLLISKKASKGAHMAFGPYLAIGIASSLFIGFSLANWYMNLLI